MQLALPVKAGPGLGDRFRLPPAVPPFNKRNHRLFSILWIAAFLLAVVGPIAGLYIRYSAPENNSQLLLGSHAGFAVSPEDATLIRFPVGPQAAAAGVHHGDRIVAVFGLPLPKVMPTNQEALAEHAEDPAYIAMGNVLSGTDSLQVPLTIRSPDGETREVTVTTGEFHIDQGARALGISPKLLSLIDLLPVISYPFLLWAAWILHRRNSLDVVSSILSLAVLLTMAAEQPSSTFLATIGVPRALNVAIFDMGNILLLAGILLFPHGRLSWRLVALLASLPILLFLQGPPYQALFVAFMGLAVLMLLRCLRKTASSEQRQQIRWALLGFSGYAVLRGVSIAADAFKWSTTSFGQQLLVELVAGIAFALAWLLLQCGLLIALLRFRLYDAETMISRSANFALITVFIGGIFAAANEAVKVFILALYGPAASNSTGIFAAALATVAVTPLYDKIQNWSERKFQRNLFLLRDDLPECVRDLRETASLGDLVQEVLLRIERGVRSVRSAAILNGKVMNVHNVTVEEVERWRNSPEASNVAEQDCEAQDKLFPVRLALVPSSDNEAPIGFVLVGPRPDGSIIGKDEQKALSSISETIARAIRNVIRREEQEAKINEAIAAQARRLDDIEAAFGIGAAPRKRSPRPA
jgi:hypothetical protein